MHPRLLLMASLVDHVLNPPVEIFDQVWMLDFWYVYVDIELAKSLHCVGMMCTYLMSCSLRPQSSSLEETSRMPIVLDEDGWKGQFNVKNTHTPREPRAHSYNRQETNRVRVAVGKTSCNTLSRRWILCHDCPLTSRHTSDPTRTCVALDKTT